jgi:hypothetical protein
MAGELRSREQVAEALREALEKSEAMKAATSTTVEPLAVAYDSLVVSVVWAICDLLAEHASEEWQAYRAVLLPRGRESR